MKLHNTLTRKIDAIAPLDKTTVRIYSCGPTVYDHIHIGNLSSFIFADTLRRVVAASGFSVQHVMNFTDVDDKTIKRSREKYPKLDAKEALQKLTAAYSKLFLEDMMLIGNDVGSMEFIKATACIPDMQKLIAGLLKGGFAYAADDGVYFSISAYKKSGKTYGQLLELSSSSTSEARIQNDEYDKASAHDFALWKLQKDGEPAWTFELEGKDLTGRPGWHIECSAMSRKSLGQPFDIHTGGIDLIFPHHENEIAQSTAGEQNPIMATVFAHNEHLLIDGRKMSKSLDNFYTLADITARCSDPLAFRLMILQAHYRNQTNFTWESLEAAASRLQGLRATADLRFQPQKGGLKPDAIMAAKKSILEALENDLATPAALAVLSELTAVLDNSGITPECQETYSGFVLWLDDVFGLNLGSGRDITGQQRQTITEREQAREHKNWAESDRLRDELAKAGLQVRDTQAGAIWSRLK